MNIGARAIYRVLVVDDDAAIRETYRQILQPKGSELGALEALISGVPAADTHSTEFEVTLAAQGEQAAALQQAALANGSPPQLAFIDMRMPPGWDGLRTAVALRAQDPSIYIVIATAFSDYDVNELQRALGHDVVMLRKPFTREEVYQLARTLCQSWQTRHRLESITAEMERQVQERTVELSKRIAQRQALADIATHCIELAADDDPEDALLWSLARIGRVTRADLASIFRLDASGTRYSMTHEWLALGMPSLQARMQGLPESEFRLALGRLRRGETFGFSRLDELGDDVPGEMGDLRQRFAGNLQSILTVPVESAGRLVGFVSIGCRSPGNHWDEHDETLLRTAGHIVFRTLEVHEAKRRLSESEIRFRSLVQSLPGAVYRCALDAQWTIEFMSDYIETLSGYPRGDFMENRVRSYAEIMHPDDLAEVDRVVRDAVARHAPYSIEYRIVHADGTPRWVYERGQAAYGQQGEVLWLEGVITDISAHKHLEITLAATAEFVSRAGGDDFFPALVQHAAETLQLDYVHVALLDSPTTGVSTVAAWLDGSLVPNWSYNLANTPCSDVLHLARRCIVSDVQTLYPEDQDLKNIAAEGYVGEPLIDSAGRAFGLIVGITRTPIPDAGMVQANLCILAARAAAEWAQQAAMRALQRERDTNRTILQTAEAIIVALDHDGRITLINRKGCELLGYSEAELLGQDWFATYLIQGVEVEAVRTVFRKALAEDLVGAEYFENRVRTRSGAERLIAWHNSSIRDAEGNVIGGMSAGEDITARRQMEQALQASELRYRELFDNISSGVAIYEVRDDGQDFVFRDFNKAGERIDGDQREDLVGKSILQVRPGIEAFGLLDVFRRVWKTGQPERFPARIYQDEHLVKWYDNFVYRLPGGEIVAVFDDITEPKQGEDALRASEERFHRLFEDADALAIQGYRADGTVVFWNRASERLYGYSAEAAIGGNLLELIIPENLHETVSASVRQMDETGQAVPAERLRLKHRNGNPVPVYSSHTVVRSPGQPTLMFCMDIDMAALERAEAALNIALTKYKTLFDSFPMGIAVTDPAGRILESNAAAEQLLGVPREVQAQRGIDDKAWQIVRTDGTPMPAEEYPSVRALREQRRIENVEMGIVKADAITWINATADLLPLPGYGAVITFSDITARRAAEEQIRKLAYFDPLTELPNRRLFMDRLHQALIASKRSHEYGALLMLDLDYFKQLNDTLGHDVGDRLLIEVAQRLSHAMRQQDTVSRLGGDEYMLILEGLDQDGAAALEQAAVVAEKVRLALDQPYQLAGVEAPYQCSASIGVTLFHSHQDSVEALLKQADIALYQAKEAGRNKVCFYAPPVS